MASTNLREWGTPIYPDFVATGSGDQKAIMGAICAVKKASFDGVDCVGGDDAATGTVRASFHRSAQPPPPLRCRSNDCSVLSMELAVLTSRIVPTN